MFKDTITFSYIVRSFSPRSNRLTFVLLVGSDLFGHMLYLEQQLDSFDWGDCRLRNGRSYASSGEVLSERDEVNTTGSGSRFLVRHDDQVRCTTSDVKEVTKGIGIEGPEPETGETRMREANEEKTAKAFSQRPGKRGGATD